jgi:hypothetical protein
MHSACLPCQPPFSSSAFVFFGTTVCLDKVYPIHTTRLYDDESLEQDGFPLDDDRELDFNSVVMKLRTAQFMHTSQIAWPEPFCCLVSAPSVNAGESDPR